MKYRTMFTLAFAITLLVIAAGLALLTAPADAAVSGRALPVSSAPPCKHEDGSTQRSCVWQGNVRGNGVGRSFLMTRKAGEPREWTRISHRKAARMIERWRVRYCAPMTTDDDGYPYTVCTNWKGW